MPRNITVYISDELDQRMKEFGEVNWSEIARRGIERYMEKRVEEVAIKNKVPYDVVNEIGFYLDAFYNFTKRNYMYSIALMHNNFNIGVTPREKRQFFEIFDHLVEDYSELQRSFTPFHNRRNADDFNPIVKKFIRIIDRYSTMVRDFASLVKEKTYMVEPFDQRPRSRASSEYLDKTYADFRGRYNALVMSFVRFVSVTRNLHEHRIDDHKVYDLLAPRLVDFRLSGEKKKTE